MIKLAQQGQKVIWGKALLSKHLYIFIWGGGFWQGVYPPSSLIYIGVGVSYIFASKGEVSMAGSLSFIPYSPDIDSSLTVQAVIIGS